MHTLPYPQTEHTHILERMSARFTHRQDRLARKWPTWARNQPRRGETASGDDRCEAREPRVILYVIQSPYRASKWALGFVGCFDMNRPFGVLIFVILMIRNCELICGSK